MESKEAEFSRVISEGGEAEKLLAHPLLSGFFSGEVEDLFNSFCTMEPGASYETYLRLHMEAFALISLKAKLAEYVQQKLITLEKQRFEQFETTET